MCTDPEGREMLGVLTNFYDGGYVGTDICSRGRV